MITYYKECPLGLLEISFSDEGVHSLYFAPDTVVAGNAQVDHPIALQLEKELEEYFAGTRREFTVPFVLPPSGDFARSVLQVLQQQVTFGKTAYYSDIALAAGYPGASRAVGNVMHRNPLLLIIPCHRVLPKSGGVGCYAGKEERKAWLLKHEGEH